MTGQSSNSAGTRQVDELDGAEKCKNCKFYNFGEETHYSYEDDLPLHAEDYESECRRFPPTRGEAEFYGPLVGKNTHRDAYSGPTVNAHGWCGEWRRASGAQP